MIRIAVCDDDLPTTELIEKLIGDIQKGISEKIDVSIFYSGESFSKNIEKCCLFDIVLMDIEMDGMDGVKAGHILRADVQNDNVQLIYISSHEKYHLQLFDVQPSGFIKKPIVSEVFKDKLAFALQKIIRRRQLGQKNFLAIHQKGKEVLVPFRAIMYLESSIRKVFLYTQNEKIEYYSTLREDEKKLPASSFIRIHQSYIVNFYFIKEIYNKKVVLITGKELPISDKNSLSVKKNYLKFRGSLVE